MADSPGRRARWKNCRRHSSLVQASSVLLSTGSWVLHHPDQIERCEHGERKENGPPVRPFRLRPHYFGGSGGFALTSASVFAFSSCAVTVASSAVSAATSSCKTWFCA